MNAFEELVGNLLERQGFWVKRNLKVELTAEEKRRISRPSCPRWELDLLAYRANNNELLVCECKSYSKTQSRQVANLHPVDFRMGVPIFVSPISLCFSALINRKDILSTGYPRNLFPLLLRGLPSSAIVLAHEREMFNDRNASIVIEGRALREHVRT